jgi:hypothetical protein
MREGTKTSTYIYISVDMAYSKRYYLGVVLQYNTVGSDGKQETVPLQEKFIYNMCTYQAGKNTFLLY